MCRLFGLNAGHNRVHVRSWLAVAPDSMQVQSRRNPDGTGVGWCEHGGGLTRATLVGWFGRVWFELGCCCWRWPGLVTNNLLVGSLGGWLPGL
jgi:hypothetical protein